MKIFVVDIYIEMHFCIDKGNEWRFLDSGYPDQLSDVLIEQTSSK